MTPLLVVGLALLASCGGDSDKGTGAPSTTTTAVSAPVASAPPTAAPAVSPPATPPAPKCTPGNQAPPSGFVRTSDPPTDFDGDGKPDAIYFRGTTLFVAPSSGQGAELDTPTAKPLHRLAAIDPDGDGDQEMFVEVSVVDGSRVLVATFAGCRVRFAINEQGEAYQFKVSGTVSSGDGVGCADADGDGRSDLVGLHYERQGGTARWTRTIVQLRDGKATNGRTDGGTFVSPQDDARIALLEQATCGERSDFLD